MNVNRVTIIQISGKHVVLHASLGSAYFGLLHGSEVGTPENASSAMSKKRRSVVFLRMDELRISFKSGSSALRLFVKRTMFQTDHKQKIPESNSPLIFTEKGVFSRGTTSQEVCFLAEPPFPAKRPV